MTIDRKQWEEDGWTVEEQDGVAIFAYKPAKRPPVSHLWDDHRVVRRFRRYRQRCRRFLWSQQVRWEARIARFLNQPAILDRACVCALLLFLSVALYNLIRFWEGG